MRRFEKAALSEVAVHKAPGLCIPEADQANFSTLKGCVAYLRRRLGT
ncbi:MAG: hypothetical protein ACR2PI_18120 [Hyphomicrobiaceae bacterium]